MPELRWLILAAGLGFIAVVYFAARRQERKRRRRLHERSEPVVGMAPLPEDDWEIERIEPALRAAGEVAEEEAAWRGDAGLGARPTDQADSASHDAATAPPQGPQPFVPDSAGDATVQAGMDEAQATETSPRRDRESTRPLPVVRSGYRAQPTTAPAAAPSGRGVGRPAPNAPAAPGAPEAPETDRASQPPSTLGGDEQADSRRSARQRDGKRRDGKGRARAQPSRHARPPEQLELGETVSPAGAEDAGGDVMPPAFEEVLALRLVPRGRPAFDGESVAQGLITAGLARGRFDIFHYRPPGVREAVFSVANLVEPGTLRDEDLQDQQVPGLTVFMLLPGPLPGVEALKEMISSSRLLANYLEAELQDDTGGSLTRQTEEHLKDRVVAFEHRRQKADR